MAVLAATKTRVPHVDDDPGLVCLSAELLEREREGLVVETASGAAERLGILLTARVEGCCHGRILGLRADGTTVCGNHVVSTTAAGDTVCAVRGVSDSEQPEQGTTRYRPLIEMIGDPGYVLNADGSHTDISDALVETLGYERRALLGNHASLLVPQSAFERGIDRIRGLLAEDDRQTVTRELETVTADDVVGVARQVTGHKRREQRPWPARAGPRGD